MIFVRISGARERSNGWRISCLTRRRLSVSRAAVSSELRSTISIAVLQLLATTHDAAPFFVVNLVRNESCRQIISVTACCRAGILSGPDNFTAIGTLNAGDAGIN